MAKKTAPPSDMHNDVTELTSTVAAEMTAKTRKAVDALRAPFRAFSSDYANISATRGELAPSFMKAFNAFKIDTDLTFVDFVRVFDSTVGPTRDEYRAHKSYQAADYLRRLVQQSQAPKATGSTVLRASALDGLARVLKSVLPLISADQVPRLWETIEKELHWTERQLQALQNRVDAADPVMNVRPQRGQGGVIPQLRIVTPRHGNGHAEHEDKVVNG